MERELALASWVGCLKIQFWGDHSSLKCRLFRRIQYLVYFSCVALLVLGQPVHLGKLSTLILNGDGVSCWKSVLWNTHPKKYFM